MTELELRKRVVETANKYYGCKEADGSHKVIIDGYNAPYALARNYKMNTPGPDVLPLSLLWQFNAV